MENLKLTIIDDDASYASMLAIMLKETATQIECYSSPALALSEMTNSPPDILIMDINMPRLDGVALCEIIRNAPSLKDLPIVLVSGNKDIGDFSLYFKGVDFVQKPFDPNVLINKIKVYHTLKTAKDTTEKILERLSK